MALADVQLDAGLTRRCVFAFIWRQILGFNRPKRCGKGCGFGILVPCFLMLVALAGIRGWGQSCPANRGGCVSSSDSTAGAGARTSTSESLDAGSGPAAVNAFAQWEG